MSHNPTAAASSINNALSWRDGLWPLRLLVTLVVLTTLLGSLIWHRITLLQDGTEVVLKTAPLDPRDLLRGYYVRLNYAISTLRLDRLEGHKADPSDLRIGYRKNDYVFVELKRGEKGFWDPYYVHRSRPSDQGVILIKGRVLRDTCLKPSDNLKNCFLRLHYGIEKFFAEQKRTRKLEEFRMPSSPELEKIREAIISLQEQMRQTNDKEERDKLRNQLFQLNRDDARLRRKMRESMTDRFAVIVRVGKTSGEAAISGLLLDGRRVYNEPLF